MGRKAKSWERVWVTQEAKTQIQSISPEAPSPVWRGWLLVFILALTLFSATANRGSQWQDSGQHMLRVVTGDVNHPLGLALAHPLHHWLARFLVALNLVAPCLAITLISSLAGAITVANVYGCVRTLTRCSLSAAVAAASLALAHTFWRFSTLAETYTLATALLSGECWCLILFAMTRRRGFLWATLLGNGLGIANHMLASLTTPILGIVLVQAFRRREIRPRDVLYCGLLWVIGTLPYLGLVVLEAWHTGDLFAVVHSALFGRMYADEVLNVSLHARMLMIIGAFTLLSFPNLTIPLGLYGLTRSVRSTIPDPARKALFAGLLIHLVFASRYNVVDQHTFFLPSYVLLCIISGASFAFLYRSLGARAARRLRFVGIGLLVLTPVIYAVTPSAARWFGVLDGLDRQKPYRDEYAYVFTPWSIVERSADRISRESLQLAGDDGMIVVEDRMAAFAVRYQAVCESNPGIIITVDVTPDQILEVVRRGGVVVLVPARKNEPRTEAPLGSWRPEGELFVLDPDLSP